MIIITRLLFVQNIKQKYRYQFIRGALFSFTVCNEAGKKQRKYTYTTRDDDENNEREQRRRRRRNKKRFKRARSVHFKAFPKQIVCKHKFDFGIECICKHQFFDSISIELPNHSDLKID